MLKIMRYNYEVKQSQFILGIYSSFRYKFVNYILCKSRSLSSKIDTLFIDIKPAKATGSFKLRFEDIKPKKYITKFKRTKINKEK